MKKSTVKVELVQRVVTTTYVRVSDKWLFTLSEQKQEKVLQEKVAVKK